MTGSSRPPRVSVIIPTVGRPDLIPRAVRSALNQTLNDIEVIVVIDGPDPITDAAVAGIQDSRLRVATLPQRSGLGAAINAGVSRATAPWVALLDDDDEWMPEKLALQVAIAERTSHPDLIVSCHVVARSEEGDIVWPLRQPDAGEPLSEYLFCQRGLRGGEGVLLPSTLLIARTLLEAVPFRTGLPMRNDVDWLLRAVKEREVHLEFVRDARPLAVWNRQVARQRIGSSGDWRWSLKWIRDNRTLVTSRAYAGFVLTSTSATAARSRQWWAFLSLLWEATRRGSPRVADVGAHLLIWLLPQSARTRIVIAVGRLRVRP